MASSTDANAGKLSITTHVLDISIGRPADGVMIRLYKFNNDKWTLLKNGATGANGRCADLLQELPEQVKRETGKFKIEFQVDAYYAQRGVDTIYSAIDVVFDAKKCEHHHIALVLSPFGYSTYRGS